MKLNDHEAGNQKIGFKTDRGWRKTYMADRMSENLSVITYMLLFTDLNFQTLN